MQASGIDVVAMAEFGDTYQRSEAMLKINSVHWHLANPPSENPSLWRNRNAGPQDVAAASSTLS